MSEEKYNRPVLCRLCEGPIVDRGVPVAQKRYMDKLRRWWKAHFDAEYTKSSCTVCFFCTWELRFADEHSAGPEAHLDQKWWLPYRKNKASKYYQYYCDDLMKPCSVKITPLAPKLLGEEENQQTNQCIYCLKVFKEYCSLNSHIKKAHPDKQIRCEKRACRRFFHTLEEKKAHQEKEHPNKKELLVKCFYCGEVTTKYKLSFHVSYKHKEAIKCEFFLTCRRYFNTQEEKDAHIKEKHNFGNYFCCFCDRYFEDHTQQMRHMKKNHKEALKCNSSYQCPNYFKTEEDRQRHVLEKHPCDKMIQCLYCGKAYRGVTFLRDHIRNTHKNITIIKCKFPFCVTYFKTEEERENHMEEIHDKHNFFCIYCDKTFSAKGGLGTHITSHHSEEEIIRCSYKQCRTYFKSEEEKSVHTKEVHERLDDKAMCIYCNKFTGRKGLATHITTQHSNVAIKCTFHKQCPTYFKTVEERDKHIKEKHKIEIRKPLQCLYCNTICSALNTFNRHIKRKHLDVAIKCQFNMCGKYFKSKQDLVTHLEQKPEHRENTRSFLCPLCPKTYRNAAGLVTHTNYMHSKRKIKHCPHCQKSFVNIKEHVKNFLCPRCKEKFLCFGLFRTHQVQCKPQCLVCAKTFKISANLIQHCRNSHKANIQQWKGLEFKSLGFKCNECFVYFKKKCILSVHIKNFHTDFEATCHFCDQQFAKRHRLKRHVEDYHL